METSRVLTAITLKITFRNSSGVIDDPTTISLYVRKPTVSGSTTTYSVATYTYAGATITRVSEGVYTKTITPAADEYGTWTWDWQGTGDVAFYDGGAREVLARQVTP